MGTPWGGFCFNLREQPELLEAVLLWLHGEWLKQPKARHSASSTPQNPAQAYAQRRIQLQEHLLPAAFPMTLVAKENISLKAPPLGCVSLARLTATSPLRSPLLVNSLWLSNLFVIPAARGRGVGAALVAAAEQEAVRLGVNELFLYTVSSRAYYMQRGWSLYSSQRSPASLAVSPQAADKLQSAPSSAFSAVQVLHKRLI